MGTRLFFGVVGLLTAGLTALGLNALVPRLVAEEVLHGSRILLYQSDPEVVKRLREVGAQFGDPQFSLAWNNYNDLDLHVTDPTGYEISFQRPDSPSGGELDVDANAAGTNPTNRPVENIYWRAGSAPSGVYKVHVHHYARHNSPDPTEYTLRIVANGRVREFTGSLSYGEESTPVEVNPAELSDWDTLGAAMNPLFGLGVMALWGTLTGLLLAVMLRLPQRLFGVERREFRARVILSSAFGGLVLGAFTGLVAQALFLLMTALGIGEFVARLVGLALLGGVLGYALHHFVPNLPLNPARVAGLVSGALSTWAFYWALDNYDDAVGRLLVLGLIGFAIGLMITIVRIIFREVVVSVGGAIEARSTAPPKRLEVRSPK
ncbi:MAG: hypothetical protein SNJ72_10075 [Fimbriimonadales bacterium]